MSRRDRFFEVFSYRSILKRLWTEDSEILWKAASKSLMADSMYNMDWVDLTQ